MQECSGALRKTLMLSVGSMKKLRASKISTLASALSGMGKIPGNVITR